MTTTGFLAISSVVSALLVCGAVACSSGRTAPSEGGTDGAADASADASKESRRDVGGSHDDRESAVDSGGPFLTAFGVLSAAAADGSAVVQLTPPFSPSLFDYYVRCASGENDLIVSMAASPGWQILLAPARILPVARAPSRLFSTAHPRDRRFPSGATAVSCATISMSQMLPKH